MFSHWSHSLRERSKLCKSFCWQLRWFLVRSQWVWLHHTVNERDGKQGGVLWTPLYCLLVPQGRQRNSSTQGGVLPKQTAMMDVVSLQGEAGHTRAVLDMGKYFFAYVGGAAKQTCSWAEPSAICEVWESGAWPYVLTSPGSSIRPVPPGECGTAIVMMLHVSRQGHGSLAALLKVATGLSSSGVTREGSCTAQLLLSWWPLHGEGSHLRCLILLVKKEQALLWLQYQNSLTFLHEILYKRASSELISWVKRSVLSDSEIPDGKDFSGSLLSAIIRGSKSYW